jgi:hypothetical protein
MSAFAPSLGVSKLTHRDDFVPIETGSHVAALVESLPRKYGKNATQHDGAGMTTLAIYARFFAWAIEQHAFPMPEQVQARFNVCKATANRWLNALADAYGVDRPKRDFKGRVRVAA